MSLTKYTFPPQYNMVKDFDLYETQEYPFSQFLTLPFKMQPESSETKESDFQEPLNILDNPEWKIKKLRVQTSFHSKLLDQHVQSLEKNLLQFLQKSFPQLKTTSKQTLLWHVFGQDLDPSQSTEKLTNLIKKDHKYFDEKQRNKFLTELFYEESLYEFLSLVCNNTHTQLAFQLTFISSFFCQFRSEKQLTNLTQDEIETLVNQALESKKFAEYFQKLQFLNLKSLRVPLQVDKSELDRNIKKLLRVLGNTIILVIEEYFINRFSKLNQNSEIARRSFNFMDLSNDEYSDDQNEFHFYTVNKKRKP